MSGSMAPDPPVRTARRGHYLRLGLIMAIGFILARYVLRGVPGEPPGPGGKPIICDECGEIAGKRPDGKYVCGNGHVTKKSKKKKGKGKGRK